MIKVEILMIDAILSSGLNLLSESIVCLVNEHGNTEIPEYTIRMDFNLVNI